MQKAGLYFDGEPARRITWVSTCGDQTSTMRTEEDLLAEINRSGFPLQLGVEELVKTGSLHSWTVRYTEHHWQHPSSNREGFIDLVLTQSNGVGELVVECKRVQE